MTETLDLVIFLDNQSHHIIGVRLPDSDDKVLRIKDPACIHISEVEHAMKVKLFPVLFAELVAFNSRTGGTIWNYNASDITMSEGYDIAPELIEQYRKTFTVQKAMHSDLVELPGW